MTTETWDFNLNLDVFDKQQLLAAARAHPDGVDADLLDDEGEVDVRACLVTLLDPGSLPGCKIHESDAECPLSFDLDLGDER